MNDTVKKQKKLWTAPVCLVLATIITMSVFTGCELREDPVPPSTIQNQPETTEPTTQPTTTQPTTTEPTAPYVPAPDILHIVPPLQTEGLTEEYAIVQDALRRYTQYGLERICCDCELVIADLSQYLTEEQKEEYCRQQYRITCCENEKQVREHIDRCLSKELQWNGYPDDMLFRDGDGNFYVIINPTCYDGYGDVEVISHTKSQIVARACNTDEDGCYRTTVFTLRKKGTGYQLSKAEEEKGYHCETTVVDRGENYEVLQFGKGHYGYRFYDEDGSLGSHNWTQFRRPIITPITDDVMELAISYGPGHVNRTYYNLKKGGMEAYDYAIAIGDGKIAYLDGDLEDRVLVVCDIFDRSNAETFEHMGFAPESMPVTEAAFSRNEHGLDLTLTYRIGKTTEVTETVFVYVP